ncbi:DNA-binding protein YbiB [Limnohabitans sp. JirII-31]|uniref:DNA-binding protein YbiB n=1 Tax=Limnohabitans sp. JirII-31 TaxID=1977908 RepID=UPI000C1E9EF1|nr:DNA-binding protein YbiB [Limnohabitans sp. JirII-31]PIT72089.1 DNA-binding protein YbiB [Limnohabitans sp. JirII-31]
MAIAHYLKVIGRGRDGARAIDRAQAADLMGQVLDGNVSDLEIGAFCLAMRIKGETPEEMAGFLDATHARLRPMRADASTRVVVLPTYNGARKLPVLTPLLAALLAREGLAVVVHGCATESARVTTQEVLAAMGQAPLHDVRNVQAGEQVFVPTEVLCPGLKRLLDVRRVVGLRNPAHSLVKLMNPMAGDALLVGSYTHPEYAVSMANTWALTGARALLLRGTEGEVVADARRQPQIDAFAHGARRPLVQGQTGSLMQLPDVPTQIDAVTTARYIQRVLNGQLPVPAPIARQVQAALQALAL